MRDMRLVGSLLALGASLVACATPAHVREQVAALRTAEGVCAATSYVNPAGRPMQLRGCLRIGSSGTRFDNRDAKLITAFEASDPADANLESWHVQILLDGERLLNHALEHDAPSRRHCFAFRLGCRDHVWDVARIEQGLAPGTYTVRYRIMPEDAGLSAQ